MIGITNNPLARRDGIAVDWIRETIAGNYVYGYTMPNREPNHKGDVSMIDPNKPLVRRDGIPVEHVEEICDGLVYFFRAKSGDRFHMVVDAVSGMASPVPTGDDIINAPEYEWAAVYPVTGTIGGWQQGQDLANSVGGHIGFIRHTIGTHEYVLIPLEDEE